MSFLPKNWPGRQNRSELILTARENPGEVSNCWQFEGKRRLLQSTCYFSKGFFLLGKNVSDYPGLSEEGLWRMK
jgi:hypothetical protein